MSHEGFISESFIELAQYINKADYMASWSFTLKERDFLRDLSPTSYSRFQS